jgi:hypothetical protein
VAVVPAELVLAELVSADLVPADPVVDSALFELHAAVSATQQNNGTSHLGLLITAAHSPVC